MTGRRLRQLLNPGRILVAEMRPLFGLAVCAALILGLAILVAISPGSSKGEDQLFAGIPNNRIGLILRRADMETTRISQREAADLAAEELLHLGAGAFVQETRLLFMTESAPCLHERLVWAMRLAVNPLRPRPTQVIAGHGPYPSVVTGEWEYEILVLDASSGEVVSVVEWWHLLGGREPDPDTAPAEYSGPTPWPPPGVEMCTPAPVP